MTDAQPSNLWSLPEYDFCAEHVADETYTKLERFIYDNEPAGVEDAKEFREGLLAMLNEARGVWESEPCQCAKCRAHETKAPQPYAWTIPGDDGADMAGFIPTRINREGEFTKPLYAHPPHAETEVEPTAEMIQQGIWAWQRNERASTAEDVRAIYIAMRRMAGRSAVKSSDEAKS